MDSLMVQRFTEIIAKQDSLLKHTTKLETAVHAAGKSSLWLQLLPFIGVIAGGIIAYAGQSLIKNKELRLTKLTAINSAINKYSPI